jgi:hypothetical protein
MKEDLKSEVPVIIVTKKQLNAKVPVDMGRKKDSACDSFQASPIVRSQEFGG